MHTRIRILRLLADGAFHSGASLGDTLQLSRSAIWKHVRCAMELGVTINAVRGRGYQVPGGLDLLDIARIRAGISNDFPMHPMAIDLFDIVDSTNEVALSRVRAGQREDYACLAEYQSAGRGRRGRFWVSPFATSIYLSVIHEFASGFSTIDGLSLAVGVAACEALESVGVDGVGLKWPNDLIFREAKLGGVLIEVLGDVGGACQAVIGIGINVEVDVGAGAHINQDWVNLVDAGLSRGRRNDLALAVLDHVLRAVREFERFGLSVFLPRWTRFDILPGKRVDVSTGESAVSGVVSGVDSTGGLILETDVGQRVFRSGEVSVRGWR